MKYSFPAFENGFIRAAAASPALRVADCTYNADQIIGVMREYAEKNVQLLCLPEFALTGYTCSDLFLQDTLLRGAEDGLAAILKASEGLNVVVLVGLPVRHNGKLYNCAAVLCNGELLGLVPKVHLPNYGEFYEKRHFIPGMREPECIELAGQETLIGTNLLFACKQLPPLCWQPRSARTCGLPSRRAVPTHWPGLPLWQTCPPAMKPSARQPTAVSWSAGRARVCCVRTSTPTQAMAKAPPT